MARTARSRTTGPSDDYERALDELRDAVQRGAEGASASRRARLDAVVASLTEQLARVARRPDEPPEGVVAFAKQFRGRGPVYDYVASKASDGYWYLSGTAETGKRYTWDALLDFAGHEQLTAPTGWRPLTEESSS